MSQPVPFGPSHFPSCPGLPAVSSPHVPACSLCQTPVALSARPVSLSKSLYFVRLDDTFVVICRESYFIHLLCGEIVLATSNDIHRPQHFFT